MKIACGVSLAGSLLVVTVNGQTPAPTPKIMWEESFNYGPANTAVPVDPNVWNLDVGNNNGWGNGELQSYTPELGNVRVENGKLSIVAIGNDGTFTSGRINTDKKVSFKYGTITMKAKTPDVVKGLWPAFWTLGKDFGSVGWPKATELNIMELGQGLGLKEGVGNRRVVSASHWEQAGKYNTSAGWLDTSADLNGTFHYYTMDWTKTDVTTYVDDEKIWTFDITDTSCTDCDGFHDFHFLVLSLAVGGGFTSGGSSSSSAGCGTSSSAGSSGNCGPLLTPADISAPLPATFEIDWIRIFDNGDTVVLTTTTPAPAAPVAAPVAATPVAPVPAPVAPVPAVVAPVATAPVAPVPAPVAAPVAPVPAPVATAPVAPVPAPVATAPVAPVPVEVVPVAVPVTVTVPVPVPDGNIGFTPEPSTASPTISGNVVVPGAPTIPPFTVLPTVSKFPSASPFPTGQGNIIFPGPSGSSKGKGGKGSGKGGKGSSDSRAENNGSKSKSSKGGKGSGGSDISLDSEMSKEAIASGGIRYNLGMTSALLAVISLCATGVLSM